MEIENDKKKNGIEFMLISNEEEKEFFKISKKVLSDAEAKKLNDEYLIDFNRLLEKKSK